MRILVTGIDGFTGQYVKAALQGAGHETIGLSSNLAEAQDLIDELAESRLDAVIHLAAIAFVGHGDINDIYRINLLGTRNLLQALAQASSSIRHILIASSANIYGNSPVGLIDEQTSASPANDYALSKYTMELMAGFWCDRLPITLLRPFNYTGVGQDDVFLIPKIVNHFKARKPIIELGNLEVWREFNDVRFVADSYTKLIDLVPETSGQAINICTGNAYSLKDVIKLCQKITGHNIDVQVNPQFVRANEVRVLKGGCALLERTIGSVVQYNLEQTLRWMLGVK